IGAVRSAAEGREIRAYAGEGSVLAVVSIHVRTVIRQTERPAKARAQTQAIEGPAGSLVVVSHATVERLRAELGGDGREGEPGEHERSHQRSRTGRPERRSTR